MIGSFRHQLAYQTTHPKLLLQPFSPPHNLSLRLLSMALQGFNLTKTTKKQNQLICKDHLVVLVYREMPFAFEDVRLNSRRVLIWRRNSIYRGFQFSLAVSAHICVTDRSRTIRLSRSIRLNIAKSRIIRLSRSIRLRGAVSRIAPLSRRLGTT